MRVFDGFTYNGESGMLALRIQELRNVVDIHIVVESTKTFSGDDRSIIYDPTIIPEGLRHKVVHVVVDDSPGDGDAWSREHHQRDAIRRGLPDDVVAEDILLISDVDEIPNPKAVEWLRHESVLRGVWAFRMDFYYYDTDHLKAQKWFHARAIAASCPTPPSIIRRGAIDGGVIPVHGGWHLSYFMTADQIADKIRSFSHQEYNRIEFTDPGAIRARIRNNKDLFDRPDEHFIHVDHAELPVHIGMLIHDKPCTNDPESTNHPSYNILE